LTAADRGPEVIEKVIEKAVVPPEFEQKLRATQSELEEVDAEREKLFAEIDRMKKAGKDFKSMQDKMADLHRSYNKLSEKYGAEGKRLEASGEISNALNEIRIYLEQRKGAVERFAKTGVFNWMSVNSIVAIADLCHEIGDLITQATQIVAVDVGTQYGEEVIYVDRTTNETIEL
jgi:seryl-tRNA synthetase